MELSHFGAKLFILLPSSPYCKKILPLKLKILLPPQDAGTIIDSDAAQNGNIIRGITSINNIALLGLEGSGMIGIPGFSKDYLKRSPADR